MVLEEKNEKQKKNRRSNKGYDEDEFEEKTPRGTNSKATTSSKMLFPEGIPIFSKEFMEYNKGKIIFEFKTIVSF